MREISELRPTFQPRRDIDIRRSTDEILNNKVDKQALSSRNIFEYAKKRNYLVALAFKILGEFPFCFIRVIIQKNSFGGILWRRFGCYLIFFIIAFSVDIMV
jgi:hypothetical protein